jgi:pimeloyl-ACP methyl ester carboxylesterase
MIVDDGPLITWIEQVKVSVALHRLRSGDGPTMLILHGLGERAPRQVPAYLEPWPGPVHALDFTGHGASDIPSGGGYSPEALAGDVDAALSRLGPSTLFGRGLGAYVALLVAGARAELVRGAILADGPGLAGGGPAPGSPTVVVPAHAAPGPPDPFALAELSRDLRPPEYALAFVTRLAQRSNLPQPIIVTAVARPPWLAAVVSDPAVVELRLAEAAPWLATLIGPPSGSSGRSVSR